MARSTQETASYSVKIGGCTPSDARIDVNLPGKAICRCQEGAGAGSLFSGQSPSHGRGGDCPDGSLGDLIGSSGGGPYRGAAKKCMEYLPCNESFETTHDLGFASPFFQPPRRIGLSLLVPTQAYDNDAVELCIGLAVASAIEAMTARCQLLWRAR